MTKIRSAVAFLIAWAVKKANWVGKRADEIIAGVGFVAFVLQDDNQPSATFLSIALASPSPRLKIKLRDGDTPIIGHNADAALLDSMLGT